MTDFLNQLSYTHHKTLDKELPTVIFGAGGYAKDLADVLYSEGYNVAACVESNPTKETLSRFPVVSWNQLKVENAQLVMGIYNQKFSYTHLLKEADDNGYTDVFMPWDTYSQFSKQLGWRYWLSPKGFYNDNVDNIQLLLDLLADDISRDCVENTLLFRLGLNNEFAEFAHDEHHYFNDLMMSKFNGRPVSFVDGGAYTGDSYEELLEVSDVSVAYLFEPDVKNFERMATNVKGNAICLPLAISDKYQILTFSGNAGPSSSVSDYGNIHISTVSLDQMFPTQDIDIIKFDIEGSEAAAINGAKNLINRVRPVLTMALYHKPGDIWELPLLVNSLVGNYKFYIRQHDHNSFESVLYAIPGDL